MEDEKILQQALTIINDFVEKLLKKLKLEKVEIDYGKTNVLGPDEVTTEKDPEFREIFLKNAKTEKDYIVVEKARWWKGETNA